MIVTNLRMNEANYLAVKVLAAEEGMSVNEYLNTLILDTAGKMQLGIKPKRKLNKEEKFWDIPNICKSKKLKPEANFFSDDDKTIYGI